VTSRVFGYDIAHKAAFTLIDSGRPEDVLDYLWRDV
jgi:hypothetical protein